MQLEASLSDVQPGAETLDPKLLAVEKFDRFAIARNRLKRIAAHAGEWAGLPMGIDGEELVIEPSYRWAHIFNKPERENKFGYKIRNVLWSTRFRCHVAIYERRDGKVECQPLVGSGNSITMELSTMGCSVVWGIEQESKALQLLGQHIRHHAFKHYLLTGQFIESSKKSGVTYMFRKLRPTIAMKEKKGAMCVLATLCMHPIGYYKGTWAGAMCPTDDVIAHLMLMRGDEAMYWRRCNQHAAGHPASGL